MIPAMNTKKKNKYKSQVPWRNQPKGWNYSDDFLNDKDYLKERTELFREHGNGWWFFVRS